MNFKNYEEVRNYLYNEFGRYGEILNLDNQCRRLDIKYAKSKEEIKNILNKNLDNNIECLKISKDKPYYQYSGVEIYEKNLKLAHDIKAFYLAKEIYFNKEDINKSQTLYQGLKKIIDDEKELNDLYKKYNEVL